MPTRGLEPPHLAVIDPKSIASASSATSAHLPQCDHTIAHVLQSCKSRATLYSRFCPQALAPCGARPCLAVIYLSLVAKAGSAWLAGCCPTHLPRCGEIKPALTGQTHSPCSPLHARLAGAIAAAAGRLLPYPFNPGRLSPVGFLSVAVVVAGHLWHGPLTCCFVRQRPRRGCPSRAGVGKFLYTGCPGSDDSHSPGFLTCTPCDGCPIETKTIA